MLCVCAESESGLWQELLELLSGTAVQRLSQRCNAASSSPWTCTGMSPASVVCQERVWTFSKNILKKQPWKWLVSYLEVEMTLSFQWTIVGFSTVCLKSWSLRSKFVSLCWVEQSCWRWGKGLRPISEKSFWRASYLELLICKKHCRVVIFVCQKGSLCKSCVCTWVSAHGLLILSQEYLLLPVSKSQITHLNYLIFFFRDACVGT